MIQAPNIATNYLVLADTNRVNVGDNKYNFYVENGKLQAQVNAYETNNIRVLVMNNNYEKAYHHTISLTSTADMTITKNLDTKKVPKGEVFLVSHLEESLSNGEKITVESNAPIKVNGLERGQGTPTYTGKLEIIKKDNVLYLVNELDIETYLKHVVSSEVPKDYNIEALKAQAICARTYAYSHLANNKELNDYNVDDSVNYQVYNNYPRNENTDRAVDETRGIVLKYNGELINALFYSTSAGVSTDGSIWGKPASQYPYLNSHSLTYEKKDIVFNSEEEFENFILSKQEDAYEKDYPYYRWNIKTNSKILENRISGIGEIKDIIITKRGKGGIAESIKVIGSSGTSVIDGQNNIRYSLGSKDIELNVNADKKMQGMDSLPSAYIIIKPKKNDNGEQEFFIYGGGYGHGVGLSQNMANEMAKSGMSYRQILEYFYDGVEIK
jgi:SpoIID/LytB domain protein